MVLESKIIEFTTPIPCYIVNVRICTMKQPKKQIKTTKNDIETREAELFQKIKRIAKSTPKGPGVYQMKNAKGEILYIGKAKSLHNRVLQYFQDSKHHSPKTKKMVEQIEDIAYIETGSELEAIILETNLIKKHRPKYNILMRDDKGYVYIKVTVNEDFPRVEIVRRVTEDKAKYFGPKTSSAKVEKTLNLLRKIFRYRTCNLDMHFTDGELTVKGSSAIPCMDYHIKRCDAPCIKNISREEYREMVENLIDFLSGNYQQTITRLTYRMMKMADEKRFETAAHIRDQINAIKDIFTPQAVSEPDLMSRDVIGIRSEFEQTYVNLFQFRRGKLIGQENFELSSPENDDKNRAESFLQWYYADATDIPDEIFIRETLEDKDAIEEWLKQKSSHSVKIMNPQKGKKNKMLELSEKNAGSFAKQTKVKWVSDSEKTTGACKELAEFLEIEKELKRIECYDISHIAGVETVGSMVVFEKGSPKPEYYRRFRIQHLSQGDIDDFASMEEVLSRRLKKLAASEEVTDFRTSKPVKKDISQIFGILKKEKLDTKDLHYENFLLFKKEKKIIALGRVRFAGTLPIISSLWVDKDSRGKNLGYAMMRKLMEKLRLRKAYVSCLESFAPYYEKFGFKRLKAVPEELKKYWKECARCSQKPVLFVYNRIKLEQDASFSETPDLIIIDGGKGQLSAAVTALKKTGTDNLGINLCSLAKKEEEIFMPEKLGSLKLPRNSQALYLIQRIRDEAHRFAHDFSTSSHAKKITKSQLDLIPGVGVIMKRKLLKTFGSIQSIKEAPMNTLIECCGEYIAKKLKENL